MKSWQTNTSGTSRRVMTSEGFQSVLQSISQREMEGARGGQPQGRREVLTAGPEDRNFLLEEEVTALKAQIRTLNADRASLRRDLARVTRERDDQAIAIKKLQEQNSKQKATIKVQSDQIAQRASAGKAPTTPHRGGPSGIYSQPAPTFNPPPLSRPTSTPSQPITSAPPPPPPPSMARQQSGSGSLSTPLQRRPSSSQSQGPSRLLVPSQHPSAETRLEQIQEAEPSIEMSHEFAKVFKLTESWARNYANVPDPAKDDNLPPQVLSSLRHNTSPETATKLISSGSTRYLAIAKMMNYQLTIITFRPVFVKGYTAHYDNKIAEMRSHFHTISPIHVRRALMTASVDTFKEMTKQPEWQQHRDKLITRQVHEMWPFLEEFLAPGAARNQAWNDLVEVWKEAARVGTLILFKPCSFKTDFPLIGTSSHFNPAQMINRDINFRQDPQTLSRMGATVRLTITPVITETNYMANVPVPRTIHYSNVLLQL